MTDTIGDFVTRIRNAYARSKKELSMPSSKILCFMAEVLKKEGFIKSFREEKIEKQVRKELSLELRYEDEIPALRGIKRISKPGRRIYSRYDKIPKVLNGLGIMILTTPQGVMTGEEAIKRKLGGEMLCKVW